MSWTTERIELLQKLWLEGCSASRIASELGDGLTRNAVIGKVFRLGLSGRVKASCGHGATPQPQKFARRPSSSRTSGQTLIGNTALAMQPMLIVEPLADATEDIVVSLCEPVTLMELRESMCRWPIGDPAQSEFRYCGAKKLPGAGPYCACHANVAYHGHDRRRERQRAARA